MMLALLPSMRKQWKEEREQKRKKRIEKRVDRGESLDKIRKIENIKQIDREKGEKIKIKAKLGYDGVGFGFEHDDKEQGGGNTIEQRLRRLANLRSQNLITEADYQQRKQQIIGEI